MVALQLPLFQTSIAPYRPMVQVTLTNLQMTRNLWGRYKGIWRTRECTLTKLAMIFGDDYSA